MAAEGQEAEMEVEKGEGKAGPRFVVKKWCELTGPAACLCCVEKSSVTL